MTRAGRQQRPLRLTAAVLISSCLALCIAGYASIVIDRNWAALFVLLGSVVLGAGSLLLIHAEVRRDVVILGLSLAVGGQEWLLVAILALPRADLLHFLQDHVYDFFGAAGLAATGLYFASRSGAVVRVIGTVTMTMIVGAMTAFSAHASPQGIGAGTLMGLILGVYLIISVRLVPGLEGLFARG